jgi:Holliday junction resolvasome RuvABC endonuclease subunit
VGDDQHKYSGQALFWTNLSFSARASHHIKRMGMRQTLGKILRDHHPKTVVIERVRLHRNGKLSLNAALALATLSSCIIDICYDFDERIHVYQLDTMDWKRAMLRTAAERTGKAGTMNLIAALVGPISDNDICDALAMGFAAYQNPHLLKAVNL